MYNAKEEGWGETRDGVANLLRFVEWKHTMPCDTEDRRISHTLAYIRHICVCVNYTYTQTYTHTSTRIYIHIQMSFSEAAAFWTMMVL